jgi:diphthamide synthase (EF-2-diphthine--ammonia ligase)
VYIASWSGGKDSCFACYKALKAGYKITYLINFISKEYKRVSFHGIESGLIKIQSTFGIPLYQKRQRGQL